MDEAERCDRVHILSSGELIGYGTPRGVLEKENIGSYEALFIKKASEGVL